ncbi:MAG: hypothetical protein IPJ74_26450 [Saprospiraceae bacterium]|nr:hypothetical protein [Saprospiraceae bacterium]
MEAVTTSTFKYANIDELNYGISMQELEATENFANIFAANAYEKRRKTENEWAKIAGVEGDSYYAVNVAKRFFAGVAYV